VRIVSPFGAVEVSVYLYPAIRPDVIAMPFGQGHSAYGRYAEGRGVNPADLFGSATNDAGDLAYAGLKVKIEKTGKSANSRASKAGLAFMGLRSINHGEESQYS
jgi:anaerobic selenocysteine-containing dehydrogenase